MSGLCWIGEERAKPMLMWDDERGIDGSWRTRQAGRCVEARGRQARDSLLSFSVSHLNLLEMLQFVTAFFQALANSIAFRIKSLCEIF